MDVPSSGKLLLHLHPRSRDSQRIWRVGDSPYGDRPLSASEIRLRVRPDQHESFASLRSILEQLKSYALPDQSAALAEIERTLHESSPETAHGDSETHSRLLADSVAFAIMRRISRESVYTARVIDLSARTINEILSQIPNCQQVHVYNVDRLDRPSLKVLARAMLLLELNHGFSWIWHSESDPVSAPDGTSDLFIASRSRLLRQLVGILSPTLERSARAVALTRVEAPLGKQSSYDVSVALVLQNYDACFLWGDRLLRSDDAAEVSEGLRLNALAAVNVGRLDEALDSLRLAETTATGPGRRAHLCYLQGLIEAKRFYDSSNSTAQYERGLAIIDTGAQPKAGEDLALERAWLLNGLALNHAILWRRNSEAPEHHAKAFSLVHDAFKLVQDGGDPARIYLRFNLLANSVFLLEMQGKFALAIEVLEKAFDFGFVRSVVEDRHWRSTIGYRKGVLHYRAGRLDDAYSLLQEAAKEGASTGNWPIHERILRALGTISFDCGAMAEARTCFSQGLEICCNARSAEGTREHALGLIAASFLDGKEGQGREIHDRLAADEGLILFPNEQLATDELLGGLRPSPPPPKLPAYIPEIDLEDIPTIDINRFLSNTLAQTSQGPASWKM